MITLDDIVKRSSYINNSNMNEEYARYHNKTKMLLESNVDRFSDKKFILQHWQSLNEDQTECFKIVIDMLEEAYSKDNFNDFKYIKSYIVNEVAPTVRDAKQTSRYLKYKTTKIKNKITGKLKKNVEDMKQASKSTVQSIKASDAKTVETVKNNVKKSLGKEDVHKAYIEILDILDKYNHCDRILENANKIQKRFNIMNMIESTDINEDYKLSVLVDSICECINTYDIDFSTKFNSVIETCFYFLERTRNPYNKQLVLEQIVNNFISKDLSNNDLLSMRSIVESSVVIDKFDKKNIEFIYNTMPFENVNELAESIDNREIKTVIESISDNMTDTDVRKVLSCISSTDLQDVNFNSVNTLISKMCSLYTGDDFNAVCSNELLKVRESANEEYIKILNKYASKTKVSESEFVMDFDMYNETFERTTNTVKDIINGFKLKKMKKSSDPRTCVSKMFTKSPDQIIDGTPNFLSWLRLSYVIGATAVHPILGGLTLLVDQFIAMKLKRRDVSKMITVFKNERKVVEEKMKKVDDKDKANLKEYDKYLKDGIDKLKEYEESLLTDNEIYARDTGEEYDKDAELEFIKDDDDNDFSLEATSFEKLFEKSDFFSKKYFTDNIKQYISEMSEDTIDTITDIACKYPNIISTNRLYTILKEELNDIRNSYSDNKNWVRLSCLSSNASKVAPENSIITSDDPTDIFEVITGLDDLFIEYSINKTMGFTNESASTNIKMLTNKFRKIMQKVSDTDKEISRKIDSSVNMFVSAMQRAARNDNREAIIRGSILPSASKVVKTAIIDGGVAILNPAIAIILALGQFAVSKKMKVKERQLVLDEIDIELEMCKRYLRQAEDQNDLDAQKRLLQIQRNLERQKQRIQYNMKLHWNQDVPNVARDDD